MKSSSSLLPTRPTTHTQDVTPPADDVAPGSSVSRRVVLASGAVGAGAMLLGAGTARASAPGPVVAPPPAGPAPVLPPAGVDATVSLLTPAERYFASRFSWGVSEALTAEIQAAGGVTPWFETQLNPSAIPDPVGDKINSWWPELWWSPSKLGDKAAMGALTQRIVANYLARWTLARRMYSSRQVHEIMTDFWLNHFHISSPWEKSFPQRQQYDLMIRGKALGTFAELLKAAVLHPAMGLYLDNARSTNQAPNENLGRELLELHSVGRGEYDEDDVINSTWVLTGWLVDVDKTWESYYSQTDHWVGPLKVMGWSSKNMSKDGRPVTYSFINYLANHPSTAKRIATKLCVRFMGDEPPAELVNAVAAAFTASKTDIKTTLRALVTHPLFLAASQPKVRTPVEDLVNTYRVMQVTVDKPDGSEGAAANAILTESSRIGQQPFDWPRPDGFPDQGAPWSSAGRVLGSFLVHRHVSAKMFPIVGAHYQPLESWLPPLPERFDVIVDSMCRRVLGIPSDPTLLDACSKAVAIPAAQVCLPTSKFVNDRVLSLMLLALLDSPQHMNR